MVVGLCTNYPEGFGPTSVLASPLPTLCFNDTILIPLPVWIYLLLLLPLIFLSTRGSSATYTSHNTSTKHLVTQHATTHKHKHRHNFLFHLTETIFFLLIIANILMQTLEIVRLALISYGIGLLPFTYVFLLSSLILHLISRRRHRHHHYHSKLQSNLVIGLNTFTFILLMIMSIIKVSALAHAQSKGYTRDPSKYLVSDQIIDVAVMAGVYLVLAGMEVWVGVWRRKRNEREMEFESGVGGYRGGVGSEMDGLRGS